MFKSRSVQSVSAQFFDTFSRIICWSRFWTFRFPSHSQTNEQLSGIYLPSQTKTLWVNRQL